MAGLVLVLVFVAGYAVQRGSICAVAAADELVAQRRPQLFVAFFACASVALAVMAASVLFGDAPFEEHRGSSALAGPLAGGALFGAGAWINGRCAFGTIARLGRGEAARLGTIAGLIAGFAFGARVGLHAPPADRLSPLAATPTLAIAAGASALSLGIVFVFRKGLDRPFQRDRWHPLAALGLIGLVNGVLIVIAADWPYTSLLMDLATSADKDLAWRGLIALVLVTGAIAAAMANGDFRPEPGSARLWIRCIAGGVLMGIGGILVPGGNDAMLLVGLPLLLPNLSLAYVAMTAVLIILAFATARRSSATIAA